MLRIPGFGPHRQFVVVQGTGLPQLALGPGHVPGTQLPGQLGNFAVAGHRVTVIGVLVRAEARPAGPSQPADGG